MRIITFDTRLPLPVLRREVRYTLVQLRHLPWAKPWVKIFTALVQEIEAAQATAGELGDALDDAEASIDYADETLDAVVRRVAAVARAALTGEVLAGFMRSLFGSEKPSDFVRPKLGAELVQVRTWPTVLKDAPAPALHELIATVSAAVNAADAAEQALSTAAGELAAFRASVHVTLVEKINGQRKALGGDAQKQAHSPDGDREPEGLFLITPQGPARRSRRDSIDQIKATVATLQVELEQAQQRLAAKQAEMQAAEQALAKRKDVEQQLQVLQSARAATDAQIAALQAQLPSVRS